nr:Mariner Mos1 transposase [Hymenolepis microstoma]
MDHGRRLEEVLTTSFGNRHERSYDSDYLGDDPFGLEDGQEILPIAQRFEDMRTRAESVLSIGSSFTIRIDDKVSDERVRDNARPPEMNQRGEKISRNVEMGNFTSLATVLSRCCSVSFSPHSPRSMAHGLADQHLSSYEEVKNWMDS